jgi:hypothetical protein
MRPANTPGPSDVCPAGPHNSRPNRIQSNASRERRQSPGPSFPCGNPANPSRAGLRRGRRALRRRKCRSLGKLLVVMRAPSSSGRCSAIQKAGQEKECRPSLHAKIASVTGLFLCAVSVVGRTGSVPAHCCSDRSGIGRASTMPDSMACFIKHVKLYLLQRYIQSDIPCHGCSPRDDCVATSRLYPSRTQVICRPLARLPPCFVRNRS